MLFLVGSDMYFWTAIIDGYMRHGEMNRALEEFRGMQGRMGGIMRSPLFVLSINLIRICTPGGRLQSYIYIYLKDTTTEKLYHHQIWLSSPWHKVLLEPRPKQSTDTPCIYAQAPYEM